MSIRPSRHVTFVRLCRRQLHLEDEKPQKEKNVQLFQLIRSHLELCSVQCHQSPVDDVKF